MDKIKKLLDNNLNLLIAGKDKRPIYSNWNTHFKELPQLEALKDISNNYGIICGQASDNLEVLDIDLKVFKSLEQANEFFNNLIDLIEDNINHARKKLSLYSTQNGGYHILYKCEKIEGNKKISVIDPKDAIKQNNNCVIETRGEGGYVVAYLNNNLTGWLKYNEITYISTAERETIIKWCEALSFKTYEAKTIKVEPMQKTGVSVWEDFNDRNDVFDLIKDEFDQKKNLKDKIIVKRHGAASAYSGYIYKDTGCLYLFSTGTQYPAETLLAPFNVYTIKYHYGNYSDAAKALFKEGYGQLLQTPTVNLPDYEDLKPSSLEFPIEIFPDFIQAYILEQNKVNDNIVDFMAAAVLWVASVIVGNDIKIQIKKGWVDICSVWIACVGRAGLGKTPSLDAVIDPLTKLNQKEMLHFQNEFKKWDALEVQKGQTKEDKPTNKQFIANDVTLEALIELLGQNESVGVFKDELKGWVLEMDRYRDGSDLQFWLSSFSGSAFSSNRKSSGVTVVKTPNLPVIGGIQPNIVSEIASSSNKSNGFMDRLLLAYPEANVAPFNLAQLDQNLLNSWSEYIVTMYNAVKSKFHKETAVLTPEAMEVYSRIYNEMTEKQNDGEINEVLKGIYPKLKTYLGRFSFLLHFLDTSFNNFEGVLQVEALAVEKAGVLIEYFSNNALKINSKLNDNLNINKVLSNNRKAITPKDKIVSILKSGLELNNTEIAAAVGCSRTYVSKIKKEWKKDK